MVYIFESNYFLTDKRHQLTLENVIKSSQTFFYIYIYLLKVSKVFIIYKPSCIFFYLYK